MSRRRNDDWEGLPATFAPAPVARAGVEIPIDPDRREAELDVLARSGEPAAFARDTVILPDLAAAARLHAAVRAVLTDSSLDFRTRSAALDLARRIEGLTGLDPNQGLVSPEAYAIVAHKMTPSFLPERYAAFVRTPTRDVLPRVQEVLDAAPEILPKAYESMWRQYEQLGVEEMLRDQGGETGPVARHLWSLSEALWVLAELLGKAGVEARVIERQAFEPEDFVIWFHDQAEPFVYEIELHPGLFWDTEVDEPVLTSAGSIPAVLERGETFSVNRIDKRDEEDWAEVFAEGLQANPGDVVLYHGTLRERLPSIRGRGIDMGEGWGGAGTSGVFLSRSPDGALYWAKLAFLRDRDEKLEAARFDRKWGPRQGEILAVLEVRIPASETHRLKADMEQAEDVGFEGSEDDWVASLEQIGNVRFDGPIPAGWVRPLAP